MNHASTPWASILAPSSLAADYPRVIESYRAHFPSSTIDLSDGRALYRHFRGSSLGRGDNDGALELGAALLSAFVQLNYTGPALVDGNGDVWKLELHEKLDDNSKDVDSAALRALQVDGEQAYALCQQPLLLLLARAALEYAVDPCDNDSTHPSAHWWLARCLFTQQQLLENATSTLYELIIEQLARTRELLDDDSGDLSRASLALLRAKLALFRGLVQHHHRQDKLAYASFCEAQKMTGLEWKLTGALGKRTKFQTFDIAQLVLDAKSVLESEDASKGEGVNADTIAEPAPVNVPRELALNDDTLLEGIAFTQDRPATSTNQHLHTLDQCLLLAFCHNIKNTNPDHGITHEQMAPFITRVIASPQNFTVHTMALLLRSRLDAVKSRTVERGVLQLQALVDQFAVTDVEEGGAEARERMEWVWEMLMPARWMMKKELGERFCAVGMIRSGMGMFEELEMWEEVVACLQNMDEEAKVWSCCSIR